MRDRKKLKARAGLEPTHKSLGSSSLTPWVPRPYSRGSNTPALDSLGYGYALITLCPSAPQTKPNHHAEQCEP